MPDFPSSAQSPNAARVAVVAAGIVSPLGFGMEETLAALRQAIKSAGAAGLKGGMRYMQRDCGRPRPPLDPLDVPAEQKLAANIGAISGLGAEARGW